MQLQAQANQAPRGRTSSDGMIIGRSPEKSHQLTRRRYRQTIHELRQRLSPGSICRLGHPRSTMDHAGFLHETRVKLGRGCDVTGKVRWESPPRGAG